MVEDNVLSPIGPKPSDDIAPIKSRFAYLDNIMDEAESDNQSNKE